ncbi:MAG: hypothetical protein ABJ024_10940 [Lentilitoribacter sp.]
MSKILMAATLVVSIFQPVGAEAEEKNGLVLELNSVQQVEKNCRIVFQAQNLTGHSIEQYSLETVLFDKAGSVNKFTLFNFQSLPKDRPRVRQFELPNMPCSEISKILINGVDTCKSDTLIEANCLDQLRVSSKISIELLG